MRAKSNEKRRAIELRLAGESYNAIQKAIGVSKGTLSLWLRDMPLPKERIRELRDRNVMRIEKYRATRKRKKEALFKKIYDEELKKIGDLSNRDLFMTGLSLYWGEGGKTSTSEISIANTDPAIIIAFLHWTLQGLHADQAAIKIRLQLYSDMDVKKEISFWSKILHIPSLQFRDPYIKKTTLSSLTYKNGFGHGTCNAYLRDATIAKQVMMGLQAFRDYFLKQGV